MSSKSFNRKSLVLSGPACSGKSSKIAAAVNLAEQAGLTVEYYTIDIESRAKPFNADIVVVNDIKDHTTFRSFLQEHGSSTKQFLISTRVGLDELGLMRELCDNFDVVATAPVDRENKTTLSNVGAWARQHFLGDDSSTSTPTSTSALDIPTTAAATGSEISGVTVAF